MAWVAPLARIVPSKCSDAVSIGSVVRAAAVQRRAGIEVITQAHHPTLWGQPVGQPRATATLPSAVLGHIAFTSALPCSSYLLLFGHSQQDDFDV